MDGDERTIDEKTLGELYDDAGGTEDGELDLGDGVRLRKTVCGNVIVNDRELGAVSSYVVERVARALREKVEGRYVDPAVNPFIKLD